MNPYFSDLSPSAQTAYAQVLDHAMIGMVHRSVSALKGTFAKKRIKGIEYWYYQYRDIDDKLKQSYLGRGCERLDKLIEQKRLANPVKTSVVSKQARAAIILGNASIIPAQFRMIRRLEEYGFFKDGGVLIGTHAYACFGNMLGVSWHGADFAYSGGSASLALPSNMKIDVHDSISSLEMGFLPSSRLSGMVGGSYVIPSQPDFRLDFITCIGRDLVNFPNLNVAMVPMKFVEYLLENVQQSAVLSDEGAFLVNLPDPARYALYELVVAGERTGTLQTEANKDLRQSASLLAYFAQHRTDDMAEAWIDLENRGKDWRSRFEKGLNMLLKDDPGIADAIALFKKLVSEERAERDGGDVQTSTTNDGSKSSFSKPCCIG